MGLETRSPKQDSTWERYHAHIGAVSLLACHAFIWRLKISIKFGTGGVHQNLPGEINFMRDLRCTWR
jgi:hypothetical protein